MNKGLFIESGVGNTEGGARTTVPCARRLHQKTAYTGFQQEKGRAFTGVATDSANEKKAMTQPMGSHYALNSGLMQPRLAYSSPAQLPFFSIKWWFLFFVL